MKTSKHWSRHATPGPLILCVSNDYPGYKRRFGRDAARPDARVRDWLDSQAAETLFLTSITVAELKFGAGALQDGKRKERLIRAIDGLLDLFAGRILAFDFDAAARYADIAVAARAAGRGFPTPDGYIAAIASARNFSVATRDGSAFAAAGLRIINPWTAGPGSVA